MKRIFIFLLLVSIGLLYGLAFDFAIYTMQSGEFCSLFAENSCLIPQAMDRWLSIISLLILTPVSVIMGIHWFFNSRRRVSTLFGWILVVP